jgi:RNA polymerase primary sigma factor
MTKKYNTILSQDINYYLKDIKKLPLISPEREVEIFNELKKEDLTKSERKKLVDELVNGNLRFVITIAKNYQNQGLEISDLISEGNIGLIKAIDRFDVTSGFKFISYAVWWIKQQIMYALNEYSRVIRIPSNVLQDKFKANKENYDEISFGLNEHKYGSLPTTIDLYRQINDEGDAFLDLIPNENADCPEKIFSDKEDLKLRLKHMMSYLDNREIAIIDGYYGLSGIEKNLDDLGDEFGCTKERIRQLKEKAIKKLRNESYSLLKYL